MDDPIEPTRADGAGNHLDHIQALEDSCPENRDFGRVLRRLGGIPDGRASDDQKTVREGWQQALRSFGEFVESGERLSVFYALERAEHVGQEHEIFYHPDQSDRTFKVTLNGCYGCELRFCPADPELEERYFHPEVSIDPRTYLARWMILNSLLGFRTRLEGFLAPIPPRRELRICVSQPLLPPGRPTESQIAGYMERYGFGKIGRDSFFNYQSRLVLGDLSPRNARLVDGVLHPFDAIPIQVSEKVTDWILKRMGITRHQLGDA